MARKPRLSYLSLMTARLAAETKYRLGAEDNRWIPVYDLYALPQHRAFTCYRKTLLDITYPSWS